MGAATHGADDEPGLRIALTKTLGGRRSQHADHEDAGGDRTREARPARLTAVGLPEIRHTATGGEVCTAPRWIDPHLRRRVV